MGFETLTQPEQFEAAFCLLRELRPHLDWDSFLELFLSAKKHDDYTLIAEFENGRVVGLMGYRILFDFVHGKHLYVDDLVIANEFRSKGLGRALLQHAEKLAREKSCKGLRLCTGVENEGAIRFYRREGWEPRAYAFKKKLSSSPTSDSTTHLS